MLVFMQLLHCWGKMVLDQVNIAVLDRCLINTFSKTGKLDKEYGKLYNRLFDARQEGDYMDFVYFDVNIVESWFPKVKDFINIISNLTLEKKDAN